MKPLVLALAVGALLALTDGVRAEQFDIPGDFDTVQQALDAVPADSTLVIHGGTWRELVITKPVVLVGDPAPLIQIFCGSSQPAIRLDGPGHGAVVLEDVRVEWTSQAETCGAPPPLIAGSGFDQLLVLSSTVLGSNAIGLDPASGNAAVSVDVGAVLVADSVIAGGDSTTCPFCCVGGNCLAPSGSAGLVAPTASVTVLDSTVRGGRADDQSFVNTSLSDCPTSCAQLANAGHGGTGIVAQSVYVANSTIVGGGGATYTCDTSSLSCPQPAGDPLQAAQVELLSGSLMAGGAPRLGQDWSVTWSTSGLVALLGLSLGVTAPKAFGVQNWLYMDLSNTFVSAVPGAQQSVQWTVPHQPELIGVVITLQIFDPGEGLSRPIVVPILP